MKTPRRVLPRGWYLASARDPGFARVKVPTSGLIGGPGL